MAKYSKIDTHLVKIEKEDQTYDFTHMVKGR